MLKDEIEKKNIQLKQGQVKTRVNMANSQNSLPES
jgi:hypothetical protein